MSRPLLFDGCCCAGGAARGYHDAGFAVVGCDIQQQNHYPYEMYVDDVLHALDTLLDGGTWNGYKLYHFDALHVSPECKAYTNCNLSPKHQYQRLIEAVRTRLQATGKPYVIENVAGARHELKASLLLCGSMFGLPMQRHRYFEVFGVDAWSLRHPLRCDHRNATIAVYGHSVWDSSLPGTPRKDGRARPDSVSIEIGRKAMGCPWMSIEELAEAIPPKYTEYIGSKLLTALATSQVHIDGVVA